MDLVWTEGLINNNIVPNVFYLLVVSSHRFTDLFYVPEPVWVLHYCIVVPFRCPLVF